MAKRHTPFQFAADLTAAALDASITLWWRWPILLSAGMPSRDTAEFNRMVSEKATAAASGMVAAQTETMRIAVEAFTGKKNTACAHGRRGGRFEACIPHRQGERQAF